MAHLALVVGIEEYADKAIDRIPYADSDAVKVRDALLRIGYMAEHIAILTNSEATQGAVRLQLREICATATLDDEVFIYLSGHGVAHNGANHFICHDTPQLTPPARTVPMNSLLEEIGSCRAKRVLLFLDCCHAGLKLPDRGVKSVFSKFSATELAGFFSEQDFKAAFCSCGEKEISYTSDALRQSVWTYYLLKALNGDVPDILESNRYLNGSKLQDYLFDQVPAAAKKIPSYSSPQVPVSLHKAAHSILIADLKSVIDANCDARVVAARKATLFLRNEECTRIADLKGFGDDDEVPKKHASPAASLVARASEPELKELQSKFFEECRYRLNYKLSKIDQDPRNFWLKTSDFQIDIWAEQDSEDPSRCLIISEARIIDDRCLERAEFIQFFGRHFDEIVVRPKEALDIRKAAMILDELKYVELGDVDIGYTFCEVTVPACSIDILVTSHVVTFSGGDLQILPFMEEVRSMLGRFAADGIDFFVGNPTAPKKTNFR